MTILLSDYRKHTKPLDEEEPIDYYLYRPIAYFVLKITEPLNLTPNNFSFLGLLVGICAGFAMATGPLEMVRLGALGMMCFSVLDCCDGLLARIKKNGSKYGEFIDMIVDISVSFCYFIGTYQAIKQGVLSSVFPPFVIILAGLALLVHAGIYHMMKKRYLHYGQNNPNGREQEIQKWASEYHRLKSENKEWYGRILIKSYLLFAGLEKNKRPVKVDPRKIAHYKVYNKFIITLWAFCRQLF